MSSEQYISKQQCMTTNGMTKRWSTGKTTIIHQMTHHWKPHDGPTQLTTLDELLATPFWPCHRGIDGCLGWWWWWGKWWKSIRPSLSNLENILGAIFNFLVILPVTGSWWVAEVAVKSSMSGSSSWCAHATQNCLAGAPGWTTLFIHIIIVDYSGGWSKWIMLERLLSIGLTKLLMMVMEMVKGMPTICSVIRIMTSAVASHEPMLIFAVQHRCMGACIRHGTTTPSPLHSPYLDSCHELMLTTLCSTDARKRASTTAGIDGVTVH